jgi:hypothetical protein
MRGQSLLSLKVTTAWSRKPAAAKLALDHELKIGKQFKNFCGVHVEGYTLISIQRSK